MTPTLTPTLAPLVAVGLLALVALTAWVARRLDTTSTGDTP